MTFDEYRKANPHLTFTGPDSFPIIDPRIVKKQKQEELKNFSQCIESALKIPLNF